MPRRAAFIVLAGLLTFASPASPVSLTQTTAPLLGSNFQGGDGNQDDPGGEVSSPPDGVTDIDWQGLKGVVHIPDPESASEPDSAFSNDSKENEPGNWGFTTGTVPNKANITNVWSAVDQTRGNTFLYLAFTRETTSGETHLAFELNRDARPWNNGNANVPCRRTGDLVVSYDVSTKDEPSITLQKWTTSAADPSTGCAKSGSFSDASSVAAEDVQGSLSPVSINNYLPGAPATLAAGQFGEAALNLGKIVADAYPKTDGCFAFTSVWMHSRSSPSGPSSMQDYLAPKPLTVRTCAASGTKFFDSNANGRRDAGEPGIPRLLVWADYNNDGIKNSDEPSAVTDDRGRYVIDDIKPPNGTYTLREGLLVKGPARSATDWICSFPHAPPPDGMTASAPGGRFGCAWGPIDVNQTPNATGRDFGNWFPAELTVKKQLAPLDDPGRFDLVVSGGNLPVGGKVVFPAAGNNASATLSLPPGNYKVSEVPVTGTNGDQTNGDDYSSSVDCRNAVTRQQRSGRVFGGIMLVAGQRASCVFRNVHKTPTPTPTIAIVKTGPAKATAGDTLHYKLYVTNPGEVAFPEAAVHVTDPVCDAAPKLASRLGPSGGPDSSPATLDPGNPSGTWIYTCSHATSSAGANCEQSVVDNTGTVTGDTGSGSVNDDDSLSTELLCPHQPDPTPEPIPPQPGPGPNPQPTPNPDEPGPVQPPGPAPPTAGDAGRAALKVLAARLRGGCIPTQLPRLHLRSARVASVGIYVNGHFRQTVTLQTLQRHTSRRVRLAPGRYRVSAHVTFERGSGTPPVILARTVRVCAARVLAPQFTG